MENISQWVGIDVSKATLDVYIRPLDKALRLANTKEDISQLVEELTSYSLNLIVLEATGGLVVCQDSFEGLVRGILDFGFWILENCPIPHFKIDRALETELVIQFTCSRFACSLNQSPSRKRFCVHPPGSWPKLMPLMLSS